MTDQMRRSWLIQRLRNPIGRGPLGGAIESLAFGGGRHNGGLSDDAMAALRGIFSFDYMGAAEFEFGAVPQALQAMAKSRDLTASTIEVPLSQVAPNWREKEAGAPHPLGEAVIYLLSPREWQGEIESRIREWAAGNGRLKEPTRLSAALRPVEGWDSETRGWLELENGFMFFIDEAMWRACCVLFGVADAEVPA